MNSEHIKPIPKYIEKKIRALDLKKCPLQKGLRFYSYLTKIDGELVKITVAMRNKSKKNALIKQVAVHGVKSDKCLVKDMEYCYLGLYAYRVGWSAEGIKYPHGRPFYDDGKWYECDFKYYNPFTEVINLEYALKQPKYRYSAIEIFKPSYPMAYLKLYEKYPQLEYLVKLGYRNLALSKLILEKAGKDKNFRKWLAKNRQILGGYPRYYVQTVLKSYSKGVSLDFEQSRAELLMKHRNGDFKAFLARFGEDEKMKLFDYVLKQNSNMYSYIDYYKACEYLHLDMTDSKHRYPIDFKRWHDIRVDEYATAKAIKDAEKKKELYAKFTLVSDKYIKLQHNKKFAYMVIIAKSPAELILEGEKLHHCVGRMGYDQKFIREESLIFFVRTKDNPDIPFVTVEYSLRDNRILQCYAENNSRPNVEVIDYLENKWLPYAKRTIKQIAA